MFQIKNILSIFTCSVYFLTFPLDAIASPSTVSSIAINKGQFTVQTRGSYTTDDDNPSLDKRFRSRLATDYGITDSFALGIHFQTDNRGNETGQYDATLIEGRFEFTDTKTDGYYSGFRLRYTFKDGDKKPDNVHVRLIAGLPIDKWDLRMNQTFAYETGQDSRGGLGVDTRTQTTYHYLTHHRAGIESFSDFGYGSRTPKFDEQNHTVGPVFAGKIRDDISYETGYRRGISKAAPDNTVKLFLTKYF
jgi:hypothetical protein